MSEAASVLYQWFFASIGGHFGGCQGAATKSYREYFEEEQCRQRPKGQQLV